MYKGRVVGDVFYHLSSMYYIYVINTLTIIIIVIYYLLFRIIYKLHGISPVPFYCYLPFLYNNSMACAIGIHAYYAFH